MESQSLIHQPLIVDATHRRVRSKRYRIGLCAIFLIAYGVGAYSMIAHFSNSTAGIGFGCTALAIMLYLSFALRDPDDKLHKLFLPLMYSFVLAAVAISSFAFYWLHKAVTLHQSWTGDSYFTSFIAFLMCAKWCAFTAYRLRRLIMNDDYGTPVPVACPFTGAVAPPQAKSLNA